jgi:tetratricopeptide (TPR) repeat protein
VAKIEQFPFNDGQAYRERWRIYFALGQADKAAADFRKAVELLDERTLETLASPPEPAASDSDKLLARLADDALLAKLTAAIERNPDDMARRWSRGERYTRRARWKEAAADLAAGLEARIALSSTQVRPYEPLTSENAALVLIDHQVGLMTGVRDYSTGELKHNVVALAKAAKALKLPSSSPPRREKACGVRRSPNWWRRCRASRSSIARRSTLTTTSAWLAPFRRPVARS